MSRKNDEIYTVDGFGFISEEEAEQARKEVEGVAYISGKTDMKNPEMVLQIYNKMIEGGLFETPVGFVYLKSLQEYLRQMPFIKQEEIFPIPVRHSFAAGKYKSGQKKQPEKKAEKETLEKKKLKTSLLLNLILAVCIVVMFVISMTSSSPTILNYETKLIDRYETWEQELTERERAVSEREQALGMPADSW